MTALNIVRANPGRPVAFIGDAPDATLDRTYFFYPRGLVDDLERKGTSILVTQEESDNKAQLARLHVPAHNEIKPVSFEGTILAAYAAIPLHIGQAYLRGGQKAAALAWYRKALAIDPSMSSATNAIEQLRSPGPESP